MGNRRGEGAAVWLLLETAGVCIIAPFENCRSAAALGKTATNKFAG
jgi:hypothetical protein